MEGGHLVGPGRNIKKFYLQPIDDKENEEASIYLKRSMSKKQAGGALKGRNVSMGGYNS
jgi:hypothetical protein